MRRIVSITLVFTLWLSVYTQESSNYLELAKVETELIRLFDKLYSEEISGVNMPVYNTIDTLFNYALSLPGSFDYGWGKLEMIGKLRSDDGNLKVFSWLYMPNRNEYHYTCYLQYKEKRGDITLFKLKPGNNEKIKTENYPQKPDDWHGKIYYELLTNEYKKKVFYTLIGADLNNTSTSIKTIEVLSFQRDEPVFRGEQFLDGGKVKNRMVFEYSADVAASVRYNAELGMIVFDHLAPLHPLYTGYYQFYGPDGSFDGLRFTEGIWMRVEDVDARNIK